VRASRLIFAGCILLLAAPPAAGASVLQRQIQSLVARSPFASSRTDTSVASIRYSAILLFEINDSIAVRLEYAFQSLRIGTAIVDHDDLNTFRRLRED